MQKHKGAASQATPFDMGFTDNSARSPQPKPIISYIFAFSNQRPAWFPPEHQQGDF